MSSGPRRDAITVAVAQPPIPTHDESLVEDAAKIAAEAAEQGAELVLFPEAYPGPSRADREFDAEQRIAAAARDNGIHIAWGRIERSDGRWFTVHVVDGPDGGRLVRYRRSHPATGDVHPTLSGGAWVSPGDDDLCVFEAAGVRFGLLICSELWLPEVSRVLALRGAEVLLAPAGGGFTTLAGNWRLLARARAIENQCHLLLTHARFGDEPGSALIAGPETMIAPAPFETLLCGELDLARARWLRAHDDSMAEPKPFQSIPGLLRARRPELYGELSEPVEGLYDYDAPEAIRPATHPASEGVPR
jgi:predicted amidohydrolase